jgi:hypothetical protein
MNWKNVLFLLQVERKSGRLIRGIKATRYKENSFLAYWPYWVAAIIGVLGGLIANFIASAVYSNANVIPVGLPPLSTEALSIFVSLPTLVLIFSIVLTMLQQIQLSGVKASTQVMYWLPVTWQEQTLASILANLLGFPLATVIGFASGVLVFAAFNGLILQALLTVLGLFAAAFMASATTEILRLLQMRFIGAVYKSSGKAAVWVRFIGSLLFFLVFYILYFSVTSGFSNFIQGLTQFQNAVWFIPFVWLGLTLYYLVNGVFLQGTLFVALSALFIAGLYYLAIQLNKRFGLYEPPAIRVQTSGIYAPKTGLLGKLGFSSVEAAIIRKDLRAFTRRRELISIFIVPIIFIIIPLMQTIGITGGSSIPGEVNIFFVAMTFLLPASVMAMTVGSILIGEEGQAVWRIYASPISAKNLVKSKFFFIAILSIIILIVTGIVGTVFYHPSLRVIIVGFIEGLFLIMALGAISLSIGFKGADFSQSRRARMIRQEWSLINLVACVIAGLAILAPLIPYVIGLFAASLIGGGGPVGSFDLAISVIISGIIASVVTAVFYRININSAKDLLRKAEI